MMNGPVQEALMLTVDIEGAHPKLTDYPLAEGDLVWQQADGTWYKFAPGMAILGFVLTEEQEATLKPVKFRSEGLVFELVEEFIDTESGEEVASYLPLLPPPTGRHRG